MAEQALKPWKRVLLYVAFGFFSLIAAFFLASIEWWTWQRRVTV